MVARISWHYYAGIDLLAYPAAESSPCDYQLRMRSRSEGLAEPGWTLLWQGSRPREKFELFGLFRRSPR